MTAIKHCDGFFPYPDLMREIALRSEFHEPPQYAGHRSRAGYIAADTLERIRRVFGFAELTLHNTRHRSGHFYLSPARGKYRTPFFSHVDMIAAPGRPVFSLVVYLTPDAPREAGTGLFRHRETGLSRYPSTADAKAFKTSRAGLLERLDADGNDRSKWDETARVDNVYNRAVLFPADCYHSSLMEFGRRAADTKLYQAFFFHGSPDPFAV